MGVTIAVHREAAPTSTGNADFTTTDCGGLTPKAVMVIWNHAETDGTVQAGMSGGISFMTGASNEVNTGFGGADAVTTTDTWRWARNDFHRMYAPDGGSVLSQATFVQFIADGVRLNFAIVEGSGPGLLTFIFFCGTDLSAYADFVALSTQDTAVDETGPSFEPDLVLATVGDGSNAQGVNLRWGFGACINDGADTQRALLYYSSNGGGTSDLNSELSTDRTTGILNGGSLKFDVLVDDFDANGFSMTAKGGSGSGSDVMFLALNFGGVVTPKLRTLDSPTATGNDAQTGVGVTPDFVLLGLTDAQAIDTIETDADAGGIGISAFTSSVEFCNSWADEDGQTTTDVQSLSDNQAINFASGDGTTQHAATFVSMDADGHTLNYSTADGTARKWFELAIGAEAGTTIEIPAIGTPP